MRYSIADIKNAYPKEKSKAEPIWGKIFVRRVSFYVTLPFINTGWTANQVSILSCFFAIIGSASMCINNIYAIWAGAVLLNIWSILDCVDGNIARCKKESSYVGDFFDAMGGYCICSLSLFGAGVAAYNTSFLIPENFRIYIIFAGSLGSICDIWSRLIHQNFTNNLMKLNGKIEDKNAMNVDDSKNKKNFLDIIKSLSRKIDYEFGVGGDELMLLIISIAFKVIDIFTVIYALYHIVGLILVFIMYANAMSKYNRENLNEKNR